MQLVSGVRLPGRAIGMGQRAAIGSGNHEPFTGRFSSGVFAGFLLGAQPGPGGDGIARLGFGSIAIGNIVNTTYFGSSGNFNGSTDRSLLASVSGPFVVPEPSTLLLLGFGLAGWASLGGAGKTGRTPPARDRG